MNDTYYNDCFNLGYCYEPYSHYNTVNSLSDNHLRSSSSLSDSYSLLSNDRVDSFFAPAEGFAKGNMQSNIYKPYKLTNPGLPPVYNERQRLLMEVQKYGFAMWDLNLYLNTHPTDRNVMMLFDQYRKSYKKAVEDYQNKYESLSLKDTNTNSGYWEWNKCPWPWEGE
jgi:spore coat protein JB